MRFSAIDQVNGSLGKSVSRAVAALLTFAMMATLLGISPARAATTINFSGSELLGIPTDTSIVVNIIPDETINLYYEYGTTPGVYTGQTAVEVATGDDPHETKISGLTPETRYFYRMRYQVEGDSDWTERPEYSFRTDRAVDEEFVFTVISDSHLGMMGDAGRYLQATYNVEDDAPDLHFDLGDTFITDNLTSQSAVDQKYLNQRPYFDNFAHSTPVFLASGNHENEEGWNLDDTFSLALASIKARKAFYPTPVPDGTDDFYTANTDTLAAVGGDEYREDYYEFEWGDALFVVIDPFQYTMELPYSGGTAGEGTDDPFTGDQWSWTLGHEQYEWLRATLEGSSAEFKFVFSHHMVGGQLDTGGGAGGVGYVRGGAYAAPYFEWGGKDATGEDVFDTKRPGWEDPIHQLFVDNGVTAYFHGHDHQYAYEELDGVVYQSMPSPSMTGSGFNLYSESNANTIKVLPNSGHLRITVSPSTGTATAEYVRSDSVVPGTNGDVSYTYTMDASTGTGEDVTAPVITLNGDAEMTLYLGDTFTDPGATAYDTHDGNLTGDIVVGGATVNTSVAGDYEITYDVQDAAGNDAIQRTRTVHVIADVVAPVITLVGSAEMYVDIGGSFSDPGATATDNHDGDLTEDIVVTGSVNTSTLGDYVLHYNVSDAVGNDAVERTRTVHVVEPGDETPPVITLLGVNPMTIEAGSTFADPGAQVTDNVDPTVTIYGVSNVNSNVPGDYTVTYNHKDAAGNSAPTVVRTVHVVDTTAPVITLLGDNPMVVLLGSVFTDPGATASDSVDGDLSASIVVGGATVNTAIAGDYVRTYNVSDAAGNHAAQVTRTVKVTADLPPEITLLGNNPQIVNVGGAYVEAGATASDFEDGDLTSSIVVDAGAVNTSVAGDYEVEYSVTDSYGNVATETRIVRVVEPTVPPADTFSDDDGLIFEADIEWLAAQGITKGCNPPVNDMYCPGDPTTRGQMAAFFHRALASVISVDLRDAATFTDTAGLAFEADIAWLSAAGITSGCNPPQNDLYCPAANVTRGQMAAFLHRGFGASIGTPAPSGISFTDTSSSVFAADIQWLVDAGITKGCGPDTYCPNDLVTRGQMAAFFHRAYQAAGL